MSNLTINIPAGMGEGRADLVLGEMLVHGIASMQRVTDDRLVPFSNLDDAIAVLKANWSPEWIEMWCREVERMHGVRPLPIDQKAPR